MTEWQKARLRELFHHINDNEQHDIKQAAKALKSYIIQLMHEGYKLGWRDAGQKSDPPIGG